jgi:hypothetical protein
MLGIGTQMSAGLGSAIENNVKMSVQALVKAGSQP